MRSNEELVQHLISTGVLRTKRIIQAFDAIDRKDFVPNTYGTECYNDHPLPIGFGQTISQPTTVAYMLELLQPKKGERILDVGSGSGWTTALLTHIVGKKGRVFGVELVPELVAFGKKNVNEYKNATIKQSKIGLQEHAPFDRILVSAAAQELPEYFMEQLKKNGRIVLPIKQSIWKIDKKDSLKEEEHYGFSFVPLH